MQLIITTEEWVGMGSMTFALCVASFFFGGALGFLKGVKIAREVKPQPIKYPELPMDKTYLAVVAQIKAVKNIPDLYASYMSIKIFKDEFLGEEKWLCGMLDELYNQMEEQISKIIESPAH